MIRSTAFRFILVIILSLAVMSCNLTNTLSGSGAAEAPPTAVVEYIIVTPQLTLTPEMAPTLTPEPPGLIVLPCPDRAEDCPSAVQAGEFYGNTVARRYKFDVPSSTELRMSFGWRAIDIATLDQNLAHMDFFLEVDGEEYDTDLFTNTVFLPDEESPDKMNAAFFLNVVVSGWVPQEPHTFRLGFVVNEAINDGWGDVAAGHSSERIFTVCPDGGCPSQGMIYYGCPIVEDCPDAVDLFDYLSADQLLSDDMTRVEVPSGKLLLLRTGFLLDEEVYRSQTEPFMDFFFELNGEDRFEDAMVDLKFMQSHADPSSLLMGKTLGIVLEDMQLGEEYAVRYGYTLTRDVFDGERTRPAGSTIEFNFLIVPVE